MFAGRRREITPTEELPPQQIEAVIEDAFAGLASFAVPRVIHHFAPDAALKDPLGTPPIPGAQAIAAYLGTFPTLFSQSSSTPWTSRWVVRRPPSNGGYVSRRRPGMSSFLGRIGYFKFDQEGKIRPEKEFFEPAYFLEQLQN